MGFVEFLDCLGEEVEHPDEESFLLFTSPIPSSNLGFVNSKAESLSLTLGNRDVVVEQSPGILTSNLSTGTTGAIVWKISPAFASWMASAENPLFEYSILTKDSVVLELGTGISSLVALATAPKVKKYVATDLDYVMKHLRRNIELNLTADTCKTSGKKARFNRNIEVLALDWERSLVSDLPNIFPDLKPSSKSVGGLDAIVACDCIYNESLVMPFVQTCANLCELRSCLQRGNVGDLPVEEGNSPWPTVCIVAQQLRSDLVFEEWLRVFLHKFRVWRLPDNFLSEALKAGSGFVVHIGVLRDSVRH